MANIDSQLPVRSGQDVDERVLVKLQDGDLPGGPNSTMAITEKKAHVRSFGSDSDGADREILLSQEGHFLSNGDYDATNNKRPSSQGLIASDRDASPSETTMNKRPTAVVGESDKVALDVAISHSGGDNITAANPLPVYVAADPGDEVESYEVADSIVKNASEDHDYTVTAGTELRQLNVECSATGFALFEVKVETAPSSGTFNTVMTKFNSTAFPNVVFAWRAPKVIAAGVRVRVTKTNLDNQAQDLFSLINGIEVAV